MSADRGGRGARAGPGGDGPAYDYRPSVKFSLRDELRLLDEALDEARSRPRPPVPAATSALPPTSHPALRHVSIHAATTPAGPNGKTKGQLAPNGSQPASRQERGAEDAELDGHKPSSGDDEVNGGHRVTAYNLLDADDELVVDRKRLLAAIICILQEELTRSKPNGG